MYCSKHVTPFNSLCATDKSSQRRLLFFVQAALADGRFASIALLVGQAHGFQANARFGLSCEVGDVRELATLKHPGHFSTSFWSKLRSRMAFSRPLLAQFPCAASLPTTSLPAPQDILSSSALSSSFCAFLRVLAFRDSFPLRFACGPLPSSGDEVSFGKTLKPASNGVTVCGMPEIS